MNNWIAADLKNLLFKSCEMEAKVLAMLLISTQRSNFQSLCGVTKASPSCDRIASVSFSSFFPL
jgi:hypothetical protein